MSAAKEIKSISRKSAMVNNFKICTPNSALLFLNLLLVSPVCVSARRNANQTQSIFFNLLIYVVCFAIGYFGTLLFNIYVPRALNQLDLYLRRRRARRSISDYLRTAVVNTVHNIQNYDRLQLYFLWTNLIPLIPLYAPINMFKFICMNQLVSIRDNLRRRLLSRHFSRERIISLVLFFSSIGGRDTTANALPVEPDSTHRAIPRIGFFSTSEFAEEIRHDAYFSQLSRDSLRFRPFSIQRFSDELASRAAARNYVVPRTGVFSTHEFLDEVEHGARYSRIIRGLSLDEYHHDDYESDSDGTIDTDYGEHLLWRYEMSEQSEEIPLKEANRMDFMKKFRAIKKNVVNIRKTGEKKSRSYSRQANEMGWATRIIALTQPLVGLTSTVDSEMLIDQVENVVLLIALLSECKTPRGFIAALLSYLKTHLKRSALMAMKEIFMPYLPSEDEIDPFGGMQFQADTIPTWLTDFRYAVSSWQLGVACPAFKLISRVVSLAVSAGMCTASDVEMKIGTFKLFAVHAEKRQATSVDLLDAVLTTCNYFVEAGYEAWKTRSLRPFLFADPEMQRIDDDYCAVQEAMSVFSHGNLALCKISSDAELIEKLNTLVTRLATAISVTVDPFAKKMLQMRASTVIDWRMEFLSKCSGGGLREAPYMFIVWGRSAVGKSTVTNNATLHLLCHAGLDHIDRSRVVTVNPADPFMSNVRSDTLVLVFDDMGAETPQTAETNLARMWLDTGNNVVSYARKADLQDKGKCVFNHVLQVGTSNFCNGGMDLFGTYGAASARRGTRDEFKLKPEFCTQGRIDGARVRARFGDDPFPDIYFITVRSAVESTNNPGDYSWVLEQFEGQNMGNVSYRTWMRYHTFMMDKYRDEQKLLVAKSRLAPNAVWLCHRCRNTNTLCACVQGPLQDPPPPLQNQAGVTYLFVMTVLQVLSSLLCGSLWGYERFLIDLTSAQIVSMIQNFRRSMFSWWYVLIPDFVWQHPTVQGYVRRVVMRRVTLSLVWLSTVFNALSFSLGLCMLVYPTYWSLCVLVWLLLWCLFALLTHATTQYIAWKIATTRRCFAEATQLMRDPLVSAVLASGLFLAVRLMYRSYACQQRMSQQGTLQPRSLSDILSRDKEPDMTKEREVAPLPISDAVEGRTTVIGDMCNRVGNNLVYVERVNAISVTVSNGLCVEGNRILLPYHLMTDDVHEYRFWRSGVGVPTGMFKAKFSRSDCQQLGDQDVCLVSVPQCSPVRSILPYLAEDTIAETAAYLVHKAREGKVTSAPCMVTLDGHSFDKQSVLPGYKYRLPYDTFKGLCMSTLIADKKIPFLIGVHVAGHTGRPDGFSAILTRSMYETALASLYAVHPSILPVVSSGTLEPEAFGKKIFEAPVIHDKSPLHTVGGTVKSYGSCTGRAKYYSKVQRSEIADDVTNLMGCEAEWGPPAFHTGKAFSETLEHLGNPTVGVSQTELDRAVEDYELQLQGALLPQYTADVRPLTDVETVSGIDGKRFIDAMPSGSSGGVGLEGPKRRILIDLPPTEEHACPRTLPDFVWTVYHACVRRYLSGERCHHMFKACLKDEATLIGKMKVRVFEAASLVSQMLMRKYFLPILRMLSVFPLLSECAVGINPYGPEWEQLQEHVTKFGSDHIVAGDFFRYDLRMAAQLTAASFQILIRFAAKCPCYTAEDLKIMEGIATDIIYPTITFNGDLIEVGGSTASGHNGTVYINSICNSLLLRLGFFSMYPSATVPFSAAMSAITYGDDFKGSVAERYRDFNFLTYRDYLASIDYVITMPDKESDPIPFLRDENCDFLKRHSCYVPELKCTVGKLVETSIFKSLKSITPSSVETPHGVLASNVNGALNEWFLYGRDAFETRRAQLHQIAAKHGFLHMCTGLQLDFDARVKKWTEQYRSPP